MIRTYIYSIGLFFLPLAFVLSTTDSFPIGALVGGDSTPPSIPGSFTATPIATTQIDLSWSASTDNFLLGGYHVYRDSVHIATTSTTDYSDIGLTASTTYVYYVTAYDSNFNISGSSSVATATTLSVSVSDPETSTSSTSYGTRIRSLGEQIISLTVSPLRDSAIIKYTTFNPVKSSVQWGVGIGYELGSLLETSFIRTHERRIDGLSPRTTYEYIIEGENGIGRMGTMHRGTFTTLPPIDVFAPENVSGLIAIMSGDSVVLTWTNPHDLDFSGVRVVRSDLFYPSDIADGWVLYEGSGEEVRDRITASPGSRQYYTIFAYDELGNISSGAVVSILIPSNETISVTSTPPVLVNPEENSMTLTLDDLIFSQEGKDIAIESRGISIDGSKQLIISLPYERVPEHLKTILVTITDSRNAKQTFSFLLRINSDKSAYVGTLAPFGTGGDFPLQVSVFDFKTAQIGYTNGTLVSHIQSIQSEPKAISFLSWLVATLGNGWFPTAFVLVLLVFLSILGRRIFHKQA